MNVDEELDFEGNVNMNDKNYLFRLEERYTNKKPLIYTDSNNLKSLVDYTHEKYDEAYEQLKNVDYCDFLMKDYDNNLSNDYIVLQRDGYIYIIGDFSTDFIINHLNLFKTNYDIDSSKEIKLYNNLSVGENKLSDLNINVTKNSDLSLTLDEEIDCEFYKNGENISNKYRGLDVIPSSSFDVAHSFDDEDNNKELSSAKVVSRKKANSSLTEKFKSSKILKKAIIVAGLLFSLGVGSHVLKSNFNLPKNVSVNNTSELSQVYSVSDRMEPLNYDNIKEGHQVFTNAYDAVNNTNSLQANEWFENSPVDVFDTTENSYMNLSHEQLNDSEFMAELAQNPDNAILLGNSIDDPSGFVKLDDVVSNIKVK